MTTVHEGKPSGRGYSFAVVVSRFNSFVTDKLLEGALDALKASGAELQNVEVFRVPGAFEIPLTAKLVAVTGRYHGVICLGTIIKGETPHWDYLAQAVSQGLAQATLETAVPFSFGVLTTETSDDALARAGARGDNKGYEAAMAVIEMVNLHKKIKEIGEVGKIVNSNQ